LVTKYKPLPLVSILGPRLLFLDDVRGGLLLLPIEDFLPADEVFDVGLVALMEEPKA
jgi:hypothetical protein